MSIQNTKYMIEHNMSNIVDLFHTKLDPFTRRNVSIKQFREEPVDELIQNLQSYEYQHQQEARSVEVVSSHLYGVKEKWTFYSFLAS